MSNESEYLEILKRKPAGWTYLLDFQFSSYSFERINPFFWLNWIEDNWTLKYYATGVYLIAIFGLRWYMRDKPEFELKIPLFLWNLGLGIFSIFALWRILPETFYYFFTLRGTFLDTICTRESATIRQSFWGLMFAVSKFCELGDTLFIVLRKRPLLMLHWYHHIATLWVVWTVAPFAEPIGRWYALLNYSVHSLMYPYFALRAIGIKVPNAIANFITTLQLAQMIGGFCINMTSIYLLNTGYDCYRHPLSIQVFNIVYGTFILLFGNLFFESVIKNGRGKRQKSKVDAVGPLSAVTKKNT